MLLFLYLQEEYKIFYSDIKDSNTQNKIKTIGDNVNKVFRTCCYNIKAHCFNNKKE